MTRELKATLTPRVRALGFSGSFPHFRRERGGELQFVTVMFSKYGGSFYVEAGRLPRADLVAMQEQWRIHGRSLDQDRLNVGSCHPRHRRRLGGSDLTSFRDRGFEFGPDNDSSAIAASVRDGVFYASVARNAAEAFERDAPRFFDLEFAGS